MTLNEKASSKVAYFQEIITHAMDAIAFINGLSIDIDNPDDIPDSEVAGEIDNINECVNSIKCSLDEIDEIGQTLFEQLELDMLDIEQKVDLEREYGTDYHR